MGRHTGFHAYGWVVDSHGGYRRFEGRGAMRQFLYCLGAICILIGGSLILPPVGFALPVAVTINLDEDTPTQSLPPNATQGTLGICEGPLSGNVCANGLSDAVLFGISPEPNLARLVSNRPE